MSSNPFQDWHGFQQQVEQYQSQMSEPLRDWQTLPHAPQSHHGPTARTHVLRWGSSPSKPLLVCAGGIVNQAYRFTRLAESLQDEFEVLAFDWYGRGHSDWLADPSGYQFTHNIQQLLGVLDAHAHRAIHVLGSSLGGLCAIAAQAQRPGLIQSIVLNDVGPHMASSRRARRAAALLKPRLFTNPSQLQSKVGVSEKNSGPIPADLNDWLAYKATRWSACQNGRVYRYDPTSMEVYFQESASDILLWNEWAQRTCPVLLIHGLQSDALDMAQIQHMQKSSTSQFDLFCIPDAGHTPSLCVPGHIEPLKAWLTKMAVQSGFSPEESRHAADDRQLRQFHLQSGPVLR
ncbi:MAG: alpha/beta hydrolase [Limnobacter sp.]|nr:alpha/beta hydrolase [Limnobacter sp.]